MDGGGEQTIAQPRFPAGRLLYAVALPPPISLNNLFENLTRSARDGKQKRTRRRTTAYDRWMDLADGMVLANGRRPYLDQPLAALVSIGERGVSPSIDTDNCGKAYFDTLVRCRVIAEDHRRIITSILYDWRPAPAEGALVYLFERAP